MSDAHDGKHDKQDPPTEFPLLKDDSVAGVQEVAAVQVDAEAPAKTATLTPERPRSPFAETSAMVYEVSRGSLQLASRRDLLLYGVGVAAAAAGFYWLLPDDTRTRVLTAAMRSRLDSLESRAGMTTDSRDLFLGRVLTFDDDVAEALYSPTRTVPTYSKRDITPNLRNNYDGQTPDPSYIPSWTLALSGLASGRTEKLRIHTLRSRFAYRDQITRLCCVEGWSAIAWWGGLRFADLIAAYPPAPGMLWAKLESSVNLDDDGNSDPYYVSIDLPTAMHPQTLLATHQNGTPLDVGHGAPLRLIAPMKLGLKNIKAITAITYTRTEPADYWNDRGYSQYDGI